jgi:hypothetical protein
MKISFCTTCKNRLEHLKQTLPANLRDNPDGEGYEVEFVLLNYGDDQGLDDWVKETAEIRDAIEAGRLIYAKSEQPVFRMAHAKNMAHRLATGDILCNLDADNFTGPHFAAALADFFKKYPESVINPSHRISRAFPPEERGFFGRIAIRRSDFERLGGYDERFEGWGYEDTDFTRRARLIGLRFYRFENLEYLRIITHSNEMRAANLFDNEEDKEAEVQKITGNMHQPLVEKYFRAAMHRLYSLAFKPLAANNGTHFGLGYVQTGLDEVPEIIAPLRGAMTKEFNSLVYVSGLYELVLARSKPRYVQLQSPNEGDKGPS